MQAFCQRGDPLLVNRQPAQLRLDHALQHKLWQVVFGREEQGAPVLVGHLDQHHLQDVERLPAISIRWTVRIKQRLATALHDTS